MFDQQDSQPIGQQTPQRGVDDQLFDAGAQAHGDTPNAMPICWAKTAA